MSIEILNMRHFENNNNAIDIAFPVLAIQCEATPPIQNYLDSYQEVVLKLVQLGLSTNGIAKTLNSSESLIVTILEMLKYKEYTIKKKNCPWQITEAGKDYLAGTISERISKESVYGYMFINVIKKEVIPYFVVGDIGRVSSYRGVALKLTIDNEEESTFVNITPKRSKLRDAYRAYERNKRLVEEVESEDITQEEASDLFADLDFFDEVEESKEEKETRGEQTVIEKAYIRQLTVKPEKRYLHMRIIIDPSYPGGYRVESPFDLNGIDNIYFLRQIQWLEQSEKVKIDKDILCQFLRREIVKISPSFAKSEKDYKVFVLEKLPLLSINKTKFSRIYSDMEDIYLLMQIQTKLLEQENIVNNIYRNVLESLFDIYFKMIDEKKLNQVRNKAFGDIKTYGECDLKKKISGYAKLAENSFERLNINAIVGRLTYTYGNSIMEKFINLLIINYYLGEVHVRNFLENLDILKTYSLIDKLNCIRRKVVHDTEVRFTEADYNFYMDNVFDLINFLLKGLEEE